MNAFKKIKILNKYSAFIGRGILSDISKLIDLQKYSKIIILTDLNLEKILLDKVKNELSIKTETIIIEPGEKAKNIETVQEIWKKLLKLGCDRKSLLINLGGGVIGDLGGFAASTFMRGMDFLQIPTTLLAQVDASVGGKVGINFAGIKNLIGSFNQPVGVLVDTQLLETMPDREFIEGFGEIIKHGLIADKEYFHFVTSKKPKDFTNDELLEIITTSIRIKADIVLQDEKEDGLRKAVNLGHTVGHAIESLSQESDKPLLHGEAVSIGCVIAVRISNYLGLVSDEELAQIKNAFENAGLPTEYSNINIDGILQRTKSDKKNEQGKLKWTLINGIGKVLVSQEVDEEVVKKALTSF